MDLSQILPLAGVVLGWLLNAGWQKYLDRQARRRALGKLLAGLLMLETQASTAVRIRKNLVGISDDYEFRERLRASLMSRHFMQGQASYEKLSPLAAESACFKPITAVRLEQLLELLDKNRVMTFASFTANPALYDAHIELAYAGLDKLHQELRKICLSFALSFSIGSYVTLNIRFWKRRRRARSAEPFLATVANSLSELVQSEILSAKATRQIQDEAKQR